MSQISNEDALVERLTEEFTWRTKEISILKRSISNGSEGTNLPFLRAFIPMVYAHWEGYIVYSANEYIRFVFGGKHKFTKLKPCFSLIRHRRKLSHVKAANNSFEDMEMINSILKLEIESARSGRHDRISARSNLNSSVLKEICHLTGVDYASYANYSEFLDKDLLEKRNHIAHGKSIPLNLEEINNLRDQVLSLMRMFKDDIENNVVLKSYFR
jgi:hypothetical protein